MNDDDPDPPLEKPRFGLLPDGCKNIGSVPPPDTGSPPDDELREPRSGLLPPGCKDLIDALHVTGALPHEKRPISKGPHFPFNWPEPRTQPPLLVTLPAAISVFNFAQLLHLRPFHILAALMIFKIQASAQTMLPFTFAAAMCRGYGILVSKAP